MSKYLVLPMQPTPNGRMHIGHGGGTYLRADVIARHLRSRGHEVTMISGSDGYENWVLAEAQRLQISPEATCAKYHADIFADLSLIGIQLDLWIDPLSPEHRGRYASLHETTLNELIRSGGALRITERVPYGLESDQILIGTWVAGLCPLCRAASGGSSCVKCGAHFQPEELIDARSRLSDEDIGWKEVQSWFAFPTDITAATSSIAGRIERSEARVPAQRYLEESGGRIRLSGQGSWGISSSQLPKGEVLSNGYYLYALYCSALFDEMYGRDVPAASPQSDVTLVGVFGSDNTTPGVVAPVVIAQGSAGTLKPFDHMIVNGMLNFEGQKCSTSKRHGIWLHEIVRDDLVSADELRYALAFADLDNGSQDISLEFVTAKVNEIRATRQILAEWSPVTTASNLRANRELLEIELRNQEKSLAPDSPNLAHAAQQLCSWMNKRLDVDSATWLVGLSMLAGPICPSLAGELWRSIGFVGEPNIDQAFSSLGTVSTPMLLRGRSNLPITSDDLLEYVHISSEKS